MKKNKYERLMYKADRLEQKSLKATTDKKRWKLQDKADKARKEALCLNLNQL